MSATPGSTLNRSRASQLGGVVGFGQVIDNDVASRALRRKVTRVPLPALVQNAATNHHMGSMGLNGNIVAVYLSFRTLPTIAGGTCTFRLAYWDGTTQVFLTAAIDLLSGLTARIGNLLLLAPAIEPAILAANGLEWVATVSNNVVTQGVDGFLTFIVDANEPTVINQ